MGAIGIQFHQGGQLNRRTGGETPGRQRFVSLDEVQDFRWPFRRRRPAQGLGPPKPSDPESDCVVFPLARKTALLWSFRKLRHPAALCSCGPAVYQRRIALGGGPCTVLSSLPPRSAGRKPPSSASGPATLDGISQRSNMAACQE